MNLSQLIRIGIGALAVSGCVSSRNLPLIFGQSQTVGISIGAGAGDQGADFVLGYKDKNIAIVPVSLETAPGSSAQIGSKSSENFEDALSVLGQFEVRSDTAKGNVGLGKFFATGAAAKALADGFASKLSGEDAEEDEKSGATADSRK
jgi:hypothetical protein